MVKRSLRNQNIVRSQLRRRRRRRKKRRRRRRRRRSDKRKDFRSFVLNATIEGPRAPADKAGRVIQAFLEKGFRV